MAAMSHPTIQNVRFLFLCLHVDRDEAGFWLNMLGSLSNSMHVLHAFIMSLVNVSLMFNIIILLTVFKSNEYELDAPMPFVAHLTLLISVIIFVLIVPFLGYFPWIIRGLEIGFGGESIFDNMLCRIVTRPTPDSVHNWSAFRVIPETSSIRQHSSFYSDHGICAMIAHWIEGGHIEGPPITENEAIRKRTCPITFGCYVISLSLLAMMTVVEWPNLAAGGPWVREGPWVTKATSRETSGISQPVENNEDSDEGKTNQGVSPPKAHHKTPPHHKTVKHAPK